MGIQMDGQVIKKALNFGLVIGESVDYSNNYYTCPPEIDAETLNKTCIWRLTKLDQPH